ncbi:uncharacterized protein LOC133925440 [Phragmites australis]|uniref:uncharacterized protein LOC133925440 n=1 Tax=Phragmites australis TaxID=29695 RepID=UPI002D784794|nr:uncharacterized protein LOC133925440 [Phragmites australis]
MPASFPPTTTRPGRIVLFMSFVVAGLVPPFSTFLLQVLETYGIQLAPELPGLDEAVTEEAASGLAQTGGPGAVSGGPQASSGAAAGSSHRAEGGGSASGRAAVAPPSAEERGKRPRLYIPAPESPPPPSPGAGGSRVGQPPSTGPPAGATSAVLEPRLVRLGPTPAAGTQAAAPQSPRQKRKRGEAGQAPSSPEFRLPAARWQFRRPTTTPPTGAAEVQGQPEAPKPAPAPEPSAPTEPGPADAAAEPGAADSVAETEPADAAAVSGTADTVAEMGPTEAAAETETQPSPKCPAPSELALSAPSPGRMTALQSSRTPNPPEEARRGPNAQPPPSQPADPLPVVLESVREVIEWLDAAVAGEVAQLEAERAALATEKSQLTTHWRSFESRLLAACAANEDEQRAMEEARAKIAREREDAAHLVEASRQEAVEALARESGQRSSGTPKGSSNAGRTTS